ncbi:NUDIX domain-containing protein [Sporosarcina sp. JAI121]|uniref:NUDIX hydrolase n=1 Tax=Sporosarcina sp. JAI121 TaxID=2723064 RepID=UPI0015C8DF94|nr:NUDIX domain-containing protein [Sporosarcina sp. JAI121]NYF26249.1 ADP-ribose pyrophosphatase YjhB (NUDIX family) [Sporosarcina sp. JAI121]
MELKRKVLAYITKGEDAKREILVFEHKDNPDAGLQVPGGTIEDDELLIDALYREIEEETGIRREELELKGKVNKTNYFPANRGVVYERNIFHLAFIGREHDRWEHHVKSDGQDNGMTFCHRWIPVDKLPELAANQDQAIEFI